MNRTMSEIDAHNQKLVRDSLRKCLGSSETQAASTPELRQWALDMASKAGAKEGSLCNPIDMAEKYISYVLKGEK